MLLSRAFSRQLEGSSLRGAECARSGFARGLTSSREVTAELARAEILPRTGIGSFTYDCYERIAQRRARAHYPRP